MGTWKWVGLENFWGFLKIPDMVVFRIRKLDVNFDS